MNELPTAVALIVVLLLNLTGIVIAFTIAFIRENERQNSALREGLADIDANRRDGGRWWQ